MVWSSIGTPMTHPPQIRMGFLKRVGFKMETSKGNHFFCVGGVGALPYFETNPSTQGTCPSRPRTSRQLSNAWSRFMSSCGATSFDTPCKDTKAKLKAGKSVVELVFNQPLIGGLDCWMEFGHKNRWIWWPTGFPHSQRSYPVVPFFPFFGFLY